MKAPQVLVVEDDETIRRILVTTLTAEKYFVDDASTLAAGTLLALQRFYDLVVLDLNLPDGNGLELIKKVRRAKRTSPIIVLSGCSEEPSKIAALDAGADDFISKPIAMGELLARLRAALRRTAQISGRAPLAVYRTGPIEVDLNRRHIEISGNEVRLTRIEYKLLEVLIRHADQIVSYGRLLKEVWGTGDQAQIPFLRVYMRHLRTKLELDPAHPRYLLTQPGLGYRIATQQIPESWVRASSF